MRVVFATHSPRDPLAAVYRYYSLRAEWLESAGHEVRVVVPRDLPRTSSVRPRWWPLVYPWELFRWLEASSQPPALAVFHSFAGWATALRRPGAAKLQDLRLVTQFHGLEPLYHQAIRDEMRQMGAPMRLRTRVLAELVMPWILRLACRRSDLVLCLNGRELAFLEKRKWVRPGRVVILPSQVEEDFFIGHTAPQRCRHLLFIGQWQEGKGLRYLAAAFDQLARKHSDVVLSCVGTRVGEEVVRGGFPEQSRERVRVVPEVDRDQLLEELRRADLFLFPSLSEGFSLALVEAMAAGLPIVCTPVGAAPDLLEDRVSAAFVAPAEVGPIVATVEDLLDEPSTRQRLGDGAAAAAREYTAELWRPRFVQLMESLVQAENR